jgi:DnaJ-class molecular chaperone
MPKDKTPVEEVIEVTGSSAEPTKEPKVEQEVGHPCPECNGRGETRKGVCPRCEGRKVAD